MPINVITGATGLLGSHIAEQLVAQGERVRALVRAKCDTGFLRSLGIELVVGDLRDPAAAQRAVQGAAVVYHCAAKVGDWGSWKEFQRDTVEGTRHVAQACAREKVGRLLHVSAASVYGSLPHAVEPNTESHPLGAHLASGDHYARSKVLAEEEARKFPEHTIVRPTWFFGPRDRASLARVVEALRSRRVPIIGSGKNPLSVLYAGDVAQGAILAARHARAKGEAYNLSNDGDITQGELLHLLTEALSLPPIQRHVPYFLAYRVAQVRELAARLLCRKTPPRVTRRAVYMIGRSAVFSSAKARCQLRWRPQTNIREAVHRALDWYFAMTSERAADAYAPRGGGTPA